MTNYAKEATGWFAGALAAIAAVLILMLVGTFGFGWFTDATAGRSGTTQQKQLTNGNGSYRIQAYDHFFDLCASVKTDESAITDLTTEFSTTTDSTRKTTIPASVTALRIKRSTDINQYNADASKAYTVGQFRSSNLPYQLGPGQETTSCVSN